MISQLETILLNALTEILQNQGLDIKGLILL